MISKCILLVSICFLIFNLFINTSGIVVTIKLHNIKHCYLFKFFLRLDRWRLVTGAILVHALTILFPPINKIKTLNKF